MKDILNGIKAILFICLIFLTSYLLGSFYSISFDISVWTDNTRLIVSSMGAMVSTVFLMMFIAIKTE